MDDGWQNPSLAKDLAIAVLDGRRGIGNGRVFPAGPLRAPLDAQLDHADALLVIGRPAAAAEPAIAAGERRGLPRFDGDLAPDPAVIAKLAGAKVLAFAGIADPDKFFATLEANGIAVAARRGFPDHHRFARERNRRPARRMPTASAWRWSRPRRTWRGSPAIRRRANSWHAPRHCR